MLKSHLLHMAHLGGVRHLHKDQLHRHHRKGYGLKEDYERQTITGDEQMRRGKLRRKYGDNWTEYDDNFKKFNTSNKKKDYLDSMGAKFDRFTGSGSKRDNKHIKPLKFKM